MFRKGEGNRVPSGKTGKKTLPVSHEESWCVKRNQMEIGGSLRKSDFGEHSSSGGGTVAYGGNFSERGTSLEGQAEKGKERIRRGRH